MLLVLSFSLFGLFSFKHGVEELLPSKSNGPIDFKEQTKIQMAQNSH